MKKYLNWMFAAILICGATLVIASCGKDDDEEQTPQEQKTSNVYEFTLTAVLPQCAAGYMTLEVEYTDVDGKSKTVVVKEGDTSEKMPAMAQTTYDDAKDFVKGLSGLEGEKAAQFDKLAGDLIVKNIKMTVPAGKTITYKGYAKARSDFKQPTGETFDYIRPAVIPTVVRTSGNSEQYTHVSEKLTLFVALGVESDHIAEFLDLQGNTVVNSGSVFFE